MLHTDSKMHIAFFTWWEGLSKCLNWKGSSIFLTKVVVFLVTFEVTLAQEYSCQNDTDCDFLHLAYFKNSEKENIYIGAKNKLLQVQIIGSENTWGEEIKAEMGPFEDFVNCNPSCQGNRALMDYYNKILLANKRNGTLIVCGTLFQGTCQLRNLQNITELYVSNGDGSYNFPKLWVTPNTQNDSTVAILVPHPVSGQEKAMAVGVTYAQQRGIPLLKQYSLSTRKVACDDAFKRFTIESVDESTSGIQLMNLSYHIFYRAGFNEASYIYFLTNQKFDIVTHGYISKIQRVCNKGSDTIDTEYTYNSMMDMRLTCEDKDKGQSYQLLTTAHLVDTINGKFLVAGFTDGDDPNKLNLFNFSAICVFSLVEIDGRFQENLDNCLKPGQAQMNNYWFNSAVNCQRNNTNLVGNSSCIVSAILEKATKGIIGLKGITSTPLVPNSTFYYTAIQSIREQEHTILFLGTSNGDILKGQLVNKMVNIYDRMTIDNGSAIGSDLLLDSDETHLFAMTTRKVVRFPVQNCSALENCGSCLKSKDPFCGWCVLEQRCTRADDCRYKDYRNHWLSAVGEQECLSLSICPLQVNFQQLRETTFKVTVRPMPENLSGELYECQFSPDGRTVNGTISGETISCPFPENLTGQTSVSWNVVLSLVSSITRKPFVKNSLTIVDCTQEKNSCTACVSKFSCVWCIYGNHCTYNHTLCADKFASSSKHHGGKCPQLTPYRKAIPNKKRESISIDGNHFPEPKTKNSYHCEIHMKEQVKSVSAEFENTTRVKCNSHLYQEKSGELNGTIWLVWNSSNSLVVKGHISVTVYKCEFLGTDCSTCGSYTKDFRPKKDYKCRWCRGDSQNRCRYSTCPRGVMSCPSPVISQVTPTSTHNQGGTLVTIRGRELGRGIQDVKSVTLAGHQCDVEGMNVSFSIVCKTKSIDESTEGKVIVKVQNETSKPFGKFKFGNPEITGIMPNIGPKSGGTRVTIKGKDLRIGSAREIYLGNGNFRKECREDKTANGGYDCLVCITGRIFDPAFCDEISVKIDNKTYNSNMEYNYTIDPTIDSIMPKKTFHSGGRLINVTGKYLNSIQSPKMFIRCGDMRSQSEECRFSKENSFGMIQCRTPPLKGMGTSCAGARIKRQAHNSISVGFKMDNVTSVQDTGLGLEYVDNPVYNNLSERTPFKAEKLLYITGKNLTAAATIKDIKVYVCNSSCMITNLNDTNLMCTLPKVAHGCAEEELPIKVIVGYAEYNIGFLHLDINTILEYILPSAIISAILLVLLIVITLKFRRHKQKRQRDMERIQNQYELLERNVRQEARQEFADLQQDIKLVTSDVIRHGVPYKELSHYTYAMLFPADIMSENFLLNHSQTGWVDENFNQNTLKMLDSLVGNKFFLLTCLRALETEKKMTARDKSYLANIVTVILLDKLDYLMQIWMELFKEHVSRAVERKQQKQIMRRNETIVEKMISNWLSLCMYDNMKNHTGSSLYMLYKATEMLTDYGPVDAVTGEAHYTLSEERLLKETIRNEQLTITVDVSGNEYSCKVLDCDAISQVKQKCLNQIYTSAPVSERPREEQVDLEWHSGKNGRLILNNFDNTTEADGEWRRINTLKHFNVKDGSKMALLSKEDEGIETDSPYGNIGCSSASLISTNDINVDEDSRIWHLVRTEDNNDDSKQCVISEIYLTRLMSTKVPLLTFLDHFVETVFSQSSVPVAVKFLFDYFDQLASDNGLNDSDVCHIWKSNTLPIRYWGKLLKAPHHAFDVCKPDLSEPSLEVLAQCFIDSCSLTELRMGKDSPASKLLFSKDVIRYRQSVSTFYDRVEDSSAVSEQDVTEELSNLSMALHANNLFSKTAAFYELSKVVKSHECKIIEALEENPEAKKLQLGHKLEEFLETMTA